MQLKGLFRDEGGGGRRDSGGHGSGKPDKLERVVAKVARAILPPGIKRDRTSGGERPFFNPEEHISQKREWSRRYTAAGGRSSDDARLAPQRLFEHFAVVGLPPNMNIRAVAADIKTFQRLSREAGGGAAGLHVTADKPREEKQRQYGLKGPALQAEVLYTFPGPTMPPDLRDGLAAFCFPHGVRPELLERTPSMSGLNEVIYSQPYQTHDDHSFVFLMKVAVPGSVAPRTLYGVCCYVRELVHRPPSMAKEAFPGCNAPLSRYLVVAPRCYCLLTHYPFFALHFRVLQTILGLERLERMTSFAAELAALEVSPPGSSSLLASSAGGPPSEASSHSFAQDGGATSEHVAPQAPAAAAVAAQQERDGEDSSDGSSRRWTEGSGCADEPLMAAAQQQQQQPPPQEQQQQAVEGLVGSMQQLGLGGGQVQRPVRPSRLAQVSPHCPPPPAAEAAALDADGQPTPCRAGVVGTPPHASPAPGEGVAPAATNGSSMAGAATPPEQLLGAAGVGPTPFFTPAGLSSAIGTPVSCPATQYHEQLQQQQQVQQGDAPQPASSSGSQGIVRSLEHSLEEVGRQSSSSSKSSGRPSDGPGMQSNATATASTLHHRSSSSSSEQPSARGGELAGRPLPRTASGTPASSRPASRAAALQDGNEDASSEASFMTASSSTALLREQAGLDASPAVGATPAAGTAATPAGTGPGAWLSPHPRSVSGTSLGGFSAAAASPAHLPSTDGEQPLLALAGEDAAAGQPEQRPEQPEAPLIEFSAEQPAEVAPGLDRPNHHHQQQQQPLLDFGTARDEGQEELSLALLPTHSKAKQHAASPEQQQWQQPQEQQGAAQALLDLADDAEQAQQQDQQPQAQQQEAQAGGSVGVKIVTRSFSNSSLGTLGRADTPPRADLLTSTASGRSGRLAAHLPPLPPQQHHLQQQQQQWQQQEGRTSDGPSPMPNSAAAASGNQTIGDEAATQAAVQAQQQQQQQGRQGKAEEQVHEVVRVTATNLDMSRPLRSADLLAVYYASVVPRPGQVFEFQPDPGLQTITFERPDLAEAVADLGLRLDAASLPDIDAAQNLGGWAVAALCRSMSLDNVITFLTAALLERQIVVFCPNAGLLSGIVLSLIPLLLPFHWQCLLLPVLPAAEGRLELMEAPVPFVVGVLYKTPEVRGKCGGLVRVNVYKDKIKNAGNLPALPQQQALHDALAGTYAELRKIGLTRTATTRPVHLISDAQQVLAECFLSTLQKYLKGLMADLRAYTITDVSPSMERTSVLLRDSFLDSFPGRDRPFMRQFAETQMFSVYVDALLG